MSTQRPFLTTLLSALRLPPSPPSTKHTTPYSSSRPLTTTANTTGSTSTSISTNTPQSSTTATATTAQQPTTQNQPASPSRRNAQPQPISPRRGSNSSSEGFRDVIGAEPWYIGGRTANGEEQFFKLGVIRRVRSNDGLSLDRLSL